MLERKPKDFQSRRRVIHETLGLGTLLKAVSPFLWYVKFDEGKTLLVRDEALRSKPKKSYIISCLICGLPRGVEASRVARSHYCSRPCYYKAMAGQGSAIGIPLKGQKVLEEAGLSLEEASILTYKELRGSLLGFGPRSRKALKQWKEAAKTK